MHVLLRLVLCALFLTHIMNFERKFARFLMMQRSVQGSGTFTRKTMLVGVGTEHAQACSRARRRMEAKSHRLLRWQDSISCCRRKTENEALAQNDN